MQSPRSVGFSVCCLCSLDCIKAWIPLRSGHLHVDALGPHHSQYVQGFTWHLDSQIPSVYPSLFHPCPIVTISCSTPHPFCSLLPYSNPITKNQISGFLVSMRWSVSWLTDSPLSRGQPTFSVSPSSCCLLTHDTQWQDTPTGLQVPCTICLCWYPWRGCGPVIIYLPNLCSSFTTTEEFPQGRCLSYISQAKKGIPLTLCHYADGIAWHFTGQNIHCFSFHLSL